MNILDGLNPRQREAVEATEGPVLIVAGAGAGKTKTITHRMAYLIERGVHPNQILAITFTNKAAREMRERVMKLIGMSAPSSPWQTQTSAPWVGTFHAFGRMALREHGPAVGIPRDANILDSDDQRKMIREAMKKCGYDTKEFDPGSVQSAISQHKGNLGTWETIADTTQSKSKGEMFAKVMRAYEESLRRAGALDFDDLLEKTVRLFQTRPEVLAEFHRRFRYIHVDEYQDTNEVQYQMVKLLAGEARNICVVGDHDQNVYQWRGASLANILDFEKDFPGSKVILLEQNYRSTQTILAAANGVIEKNTARVKKNLFTEGEEGELIVRMGGYDEKHEASKVADKIQELMAKGVGPSDIVILYRNNYLSRVLEESMLTNGIPYQVLGTRFYDRAEVKDVLAYIRLAMNPESVVDLMRVINEPARGIGAVTLEKVLSGKMSELAAGARGKVQSFYDIVERIRAAAQVQQPSQLVMTALKESGIEKHLRDNDDEERLGNVFELISVAKRYDIPTVEGSETVDALFGIRQMLEDVALEGDQDRMKDEEAVRLMTVHASKGLEFDYVFIVGLEEGLFPSERSKSASTVAEREEERRLFYVALTRAAKRVYLSHSSSRMVFGKRDYAFPSSFFDDIDDGLIEEEVTTTNFGFGNSEGGKKSGFGGHKGLLDDWEEDTFEW